MRIIDSLKTIAVNLLRSLALLMFMPRPASLPIVMPEMVQLSLVHDMSSLSAIGFVYFGSMLVRAGNIGERDITM